MSGQYCAEHDFYYSPNHIIDVVCPWCEIDRLNKEINRLRQYEDAITSAVDGTLLVWNLMSTNHTVIKNDYWQNHLEEIDRLKAELGYKSVELAKAYRDVSQHQSIAQKYDDRYCSELVKNNDLERQLAEARADVERQQKEIIALRKSVIGLERCSSDEAPGLIKQQARQDVAREILEWAAGPESYDEWVVMVRKRFGLEV